MYLVMQLALALLTAVQCIQHETLSESWMAAVVRKNFISLESGLAERPLYILTTSLRESPPSSEEQLELSLFSTTGPFMTTLSVQFTNPPRFKVKCLAADWTYFPGPSWTDFSELYTIWSLTMSDTALVLGCNGAEVLNLEYSSQPCAKRWGTTETGSVRFSTRDTASIRYSQESPVCVRPEIENGTVQPVQTLIFTDSAYTLACNTGYKPSSEAPMLCKEDGSLGVLPECELFVEDEVNPVEERVRSSSYTVRLGTVMACTATVLAAWFRTL